MSIHSIRSPWRYLVGVVVRMVRLEPGSAPRDNYEVEPVEEPRGDEPAKPIPLSHLPAGSRATIVKLIGSQSFRSRLRALGLHEGAELRCIRRSPFGDPVEISIYNLHIALRLKDASKVLVHPL